MSPSTSTTSDPSTSSFDPPSIEFSLQNGLIFQKVMRNSSQYNLTPTDRLLLEDGRQSMANHTRYGFILGAILSPLPLFRGQYAINNLRNLPPLMDQKTQRPNPVVLRARLFWIVQSVILTTLGSGLGTWIGFKLGLKSMEQKLDTIPGSRERLLNAFIQARKELDSASLNHQHQESRSSPGRHKPLIIPTSQISPIQTEDERPFQDSQETSLSLSSSPDQTNPTDSRTRNLSQSNQSKPSRWEELRRLPQSHHSTWETIREQNLKPKVPSTPNESPSPSNTYQQNLNPHELQQFTESSKFAQSQSQDEFEKLLDRERNLSAGIIQPSDRYSSPKH